MQALMSASTVSLCQAALPLALGEDLIQPDIHWLTKKQEENPPLNKASQAKPDTPHPLATFHFCNFDSPKAFSKLDLCNRPNNALIGVKPGFDKRHQSTETPSINHAAKNSPPLRKKKSVAQSTLSQEGFIWTLEHS